MCAERLCADLVGKAKVLATALLLGILVASQASAQSPDIDWLKKPEAPTGKTSVGPKGARTPEQQAQASRRPAAEADPLKIESAKIDPKALDGKTPNNLILLGRLELRGGNLAGAKASLQSAMALGSQSSNKAAVAAAARVLGVLYSGRFATLRTEARNVASFGARPSDELTGATRSEFDKAKSFLEKALGLHQALGRKDAVAADYALLGDLYRSAKDFDQAQAMVGNALSLNKALQRKAEMAGNYRALADTQRYDLDQAEGLLREATALHEALGLKVELAADYEKLGAIQAMRGEPYEAERLYQQALADASRQSQIGILRALARLYRDRSDPSQAAEMDEKAATLTAEHKAEGGGERFLFSADLGLYVSSVITKEQIETLEKLVPVQTALNHRIGLATSYLLLGLHYDGRAEIDKDKRSELQGRAEAMFKNALAAFKSLAREDGMAFAYREFAVNSVKRGNLAQVDEALSGAAPLYKKLGDEREVAQLYLTLGFTSKSLGDADRACSYWRRGALAYPDDRRLLETLNSNQCATTQ